MMKNSKVAYCEKCDNDVDFYINEEKMTITKNGVTFTYLYKKAYCKNCKTTVFPVSIGRENYISLTDAYKSAIGLLTSKEIISIRKQNSLTQEQLAKKIKCGKKNIARYENGAVQTKTIDNAIRNLNSNVIFFNFFSESPYDDKIEIYDDKKFLKCKHLNNDYSKCRYKQSSMSLCVSK